MKIVMTVEDSKTRDDIKVTMDLLNSGIGDAAEGQPYGATLMYDVLTALMEGLKGPYGAELATTVLSYGMGGAGDATGDPIN